jgi:hypothetical protein
VELGAEQLVRSILAADNERSLGEDGTGRRASGQGGLRWCAHRRCGPTAAAASAEVEGTRRAAADCRLLQRTRVQRGDLGEITPLQVGPAQREGS